MATYHTPVMVAEVTHYLEPAPDKVYLDGTLGTGGHAAAVLKQSEPTGRVVGIDADPESLELAKKRLAPYGDRVVFAHARYENARSILAGHGLRRVHGALLDLGISKVQLEMPGRGFSFSRDDPLDMRMDRTRGHTAAEVLAGLREEGIVRLFRSYGQERWAGRIARAIVLSRETRGKVASTLELAQTIRNAVPARFRRARIHPATRCFQALRIEVNRELEGLGRFLEDLPELLEPGGRCCILTFHSLEDRLVKQGFRSLEQGLSQDPVQAGAAVPPGQAPKFRRVLKKVLRPSREEVVANPLSRSAKLRVLERC